MGHVFSLHFVGKILFRLGRVIVFATYYGKDLDEGYKKRGGSLFGRKAISLDIIPF